MNEFEVMTQLWVARTHFVLRFIVMISAIYLLFKKIQPPRPKSSWFNLPFLGLIALLVYLLGWTPVPWYSYADRHLYADRIIGVATEGMVATEDLADKFFYYLTSFITDYGDHKDAFHFIALLYVVGYAYTSKKLVSQNAYWMLLAVAVGFQFVSYGVNTIRSGLAMAFMFVGMVNYSRRFIMYLFFTLAAMTHLSLLIPIGMFIIARYFDKTPFFFTLWFLSIPVSLWLGDTFNELLAGMFDDQRVSYLKGEVGEYKRSFRYDFVVYSLIPLIYGAFFIFHKKFKSRFYKSLFNAYILTNIFWVLVITASFSDRFASLSWCMMPILLTYPLLSQPSIVKNPNLWMFSILVGCIIFNSLF